ncbi:MAG: histidine kinase [Burkholderiaceae bacterium]
MTALSVGKSPRREPGNLPAQSHEGTQPRSASLAVRLTLVVALAMLILVSSASLFRMSMLQDDALAEIGSSQQIAWLALPRKLQDGQAPATQVAEIISRFEQARHVIVEFAPHDPEHAALASDNSRELVPPATDWYDISRWTRLPEPLVREVTWAGASVGHFRVLPDPHDEIGERWRHILVDLMLISLITLVLGLLVYWAVTRALHPLREVSGALTALGKGDLSVRLKPMGFAEFDDLPGNFNRMAAELDEAMASRRHLTDRMVTVEEKTRRQIAHALHDELSPYLVAIQPNIAVLESASARDSALAEYSGSIATISAHLRSTIQRMRQILETLHPPELASLGLVRAIGEIAQMQEAARPGMLTIKLDLDESLEGVSEAVDTTLFRTVQESLTNALKHTDCALIEVRLQQVDDTSGRRIALSVWNDGERLTAHHEGHGLGTLGITDRVHALGGEVTLGPSSRSAGGWEVAVSLPFGVADHD